MDRLALASARASLQKEFCQVLEPSSLQKLHGLMNGLNPQLLGQVRKTTARARLARQEPIVRTAKEFEQGQAASCPEDDLALLLDFLERQQAMQDSDDHVVRLEAENDRLKSATAGLQDKVAQLTSEKSQLDNTVAGLRAELAAAIAIQQQPQDSDEVARLRTENQAARTDSLEKHLKSCETHNKQLACIQGEKNRLQADKDDLQRRLSDLKADVAFYKKLLEQQGLKASVSSTLSAGGSVAPSDAVGGVVQAQVPGPALLPVPTLNIAATFDSQKDHVRLLLNELARLKARERQQESERLRSADGLQQPDILAAEIVADAGVNAITADLESTTISPQASGSAHVAVKPVPKNKARSSRRKKNTKVNAVLKACVDLLRKRGVFLISRKSFKEIASNVPNFSRSAEDVGRMLLACFKDIVGNELRHCPGCNQRLADRPEGKLAHLNYGCPQLIKGQNHAVLTLDWKSWPSDWLNRFNVSEQQ